MHVVICIIVEPPLSQGLCYTATEGLFSWNAEDRPFLQVYSEKRNLVSI